MRWQENWARSVLCSVLSGTLTNVSVREWFVCIYGFHSRYTIIYFTVCAMNSSGHLEFSQILSKCDWKVGDVGSYMWNLTFWLLCDSRFVADENIFNLFLEQTRHQTDIWGKKTLCIEVTSWSISSPEGSGHTSDELKWQSDLCEARAPPGHPYQAVTNLCEARVEALRSRGLMSSVITGRMWC